MMLNLDKIFLVILKIYWRLILRCREQIFQLILIKIQQYFLSNHKEIYLLKIYKISHLSCLKYLHEEIPAEHIDFYKKNRDLFKEVDELINKRNDLKDLIADYFRVTAFYYTINFETEYLKKEADKYFKKATEFSESVQKLDKKSFTQLSKLIQKEYTKAKKELKKQKKDFIANKMYEKLPKIEITTSHITFLISISAALFLITGYLYNRFYLGYFGIEVSQFFTINDYISSSIDKIYIASIAALFGLLNVIYSMLKTIKKHTLYSQYELEYKVSDSNTFIFVFIFLVLITIFSFYKDINGKFYLLSSLIFIVLLEIYFKLPIEKLIKNSIYVTIVCVSIIYFSVHMFCEISNDIDRVNHIESKNLNKYIYSFKNKNLKHINEMIFLSANSNYIFFYDKDEKKAYIVPKSEISVIESR